MKKSLLYITIVASTCMLILLLTVNNISYSQGIVEAFSNNAQNKTNYIVNTLIILVLSLLILELIRIKLKSLINIIISYGFKRYKIYLSSLKKEKDDNIKNQVPENNLNEAVIKIDDSKLKEYESKLEEKIDVVNKEINVILNLCVRILQIVLILAFIDYALYSHPVTNAYVKDFTHLILSIIVVIKDSFFDWIISRHTWKAIGSILLIVVITSLLISIVGAISSALENIIQLMLDAEKGREKRIQTIAKVLRTTIKIVLIALAIVLVLSELGINVTPIIAGAGILGLAISFGSQNLVKDIINGIFILLENQFAIGDVITIGNLGGVVEDMTLRKTILRDLSGHVHIIPNSEVTKVTVLTKKWARANLDISIAYHNDIDTAIKIIKETADKMYKEFPEKIIAEPQVLGVNNLAESAVEIKLIIDTNAGDQWFTEREFRRRIKYALQENNIEIPYPHRTIYMSEK